VLFFVFLFVLLLFLLVLLLTGGVLPSWAGAQRRCAAKNYSEDRCQRNERRVQTPQTGLLHVHDRFPPYRLTKLLTRESQLATDWLRASRRTHPSALLDASNVEAFRPHQDRKSTRLN